MPIIELGNSSFNTTNIRTTQSTQMGAVVGKTLESLWSKYRKKIVLSALVSKNTMLEGEGGGDTISFFKLSNYLSPESVTNSNWNDPYSFSQYSIEKDSIIINRIFRVGFSETMLDRAFSTNRSANTETFLDGLTYAMAKQKEEDIIAAYLDFGNSYNSTGVTGGSTFVQQKDLTQLMREFNDASVPESGRILVLGNYDTLQFLNKAIDDKQPFGEVSPYQMENGFVKRQMGFDIFTSPLIASEINSSYNTVYHNMAFIPSTITIASKSLMPTMDELNSGDYPGMTFAQINDAGTGGTFLLVRASTPNPPATSYTLFMAYGVKVTWSESGWDVISTEA